MGNALASREARRIKAWRVRIELNLFHRTPGVVIPRLAKRTEGSPPRGS
jgi:hypothetical protein